MIQHDGVAGKKQLLGQHHFPALGRVDGVPAVRQIHTAMRGAWFRSEFGCFPKFEPDVTPSKGTRNLPFHSRSGVTRRKSRGNDRALHWRA